MADHDKEAPPQSADAAGDMRVQASRLTEQTKQAAQDAAGRAREQGRAMFDQHKDSAADQAEGVAGALRETAGKLEDEGRSDMSRYIGMAAERLEDFGRRLRGKDAEALLREAEEMGRRSPGALFAGAVTAGFLLSRFLKSSARHRHEAVQPWHDPAAGMTSGGMHDDMHSQPYESWQRADAEHEDIASDTHAARGAAGSSGIQGIAGSSATGSATVAPSSGNGAQPAGGSHGNR